MHAKTKELSPIGGWGLRLARPLDLPMVHEFFFFCHHQHVVLIWSSRSRLSQGQGHFRSKSVSVLITITKLALGYRPKRKHAKLASLHFWTFHSCVYILIWFMCRIISHNCTNQTSQNCDRNVCMLQCILLESGLKMNVLHYPSCEAVIRYVKTAQPFNNFKVYSWIHRLLRL